MLASRLVSLAVLLSLLLVDGILQAQESFFSGTDAVPATPEIPLLKLENEIADDRVTAATYFLQARMAKKRRQPRVALPAFERAVRYDSSNSELFKQIIALAYETQQPELAVRYAAIAPQTVLTDLILLRRLGMDATSQKNWSQACKFYEQSLKLEGVVPEGSTTQVLLHAELGRLYYLAGKPLESHKAFEKVRDALTHPEKYSLSDALRKLLLGEPRKTYELMSRAALGAKDYSQALLFLENAFVDAPTAPEYVAAQIEIHLAHKDWPAAELKLKTLLSSNDYGKISPLLQLKALLEQQSPQQASQNYATQLNELFAKYPQNTELRLALAELALEQQDYEAVVKFLPRDAVATHSARGWAIQAEAYRTQDQAENWITHLGHWHAASLKNETLNSGWEAEIARGAAQENLASHVAKFAETWVVDSKPHAPSQLFVLANVLFATKQFELAQRLWQASLPEEASARAASSLAWGAMLLQAERYEHAIKTFNGIPFDGLEKSTLAQIHYYLSVCYSLSKQHELAKFEIAKALLQATDNPHFLMRQAWVHYAAEDYATAQKMYEAMLKKWEHVPDSSIREVLRDARSALSNVYVKRQLNSEALEMLEQTLDEYPQDYGTLNDLAYLWAEQKRHPARALQMAQQAVAAEPDNASFLDTLGWVLHQQAKYGEAIAVFAKAANLQPEGVILEHYGDALLQAGKQTQALETWQQAYKWYSQQSEQAKAEQVANKLKSLESMAKQDE
jgi:tetratricopeptide (TPR) repeat protein